MGQVPEAPAAAEFKLGAARKRSTCCLPLMGLPCHPSLQVLANHFVGHVLRARRHTVCKCMPAAPQP